MLWRVSGCEELVGVTHRRLWAGDDRDATAKSISV